MAECASSSPNPPSEPPPCPPPSNTLGPTSPNCARSILPPSPSASPTTRPTRPTCRRRWRSPRPRTWWPPSPRSRPSGRSSAASRSADLEPLTGRELTRCEREPAVPPAADDRQLHRAVDRVGGEQPLEVVDAADRLVADADDKILRPHPRMIGRRVGDHLDHLEAARPAERRGHDGRQRSCPARDPDPRA